MNKEKDLNCIVCGEKLDILTQDGIDKYVCRNGYDDNDFEHNPNDNCSEYEIEKTLLTLATELQIESENYAKRCNEYYIHITNLKAKIKDLKREKESKTFKGKIKLLVKWYYATRQKWIYSHCKHTPVTHISNGGESWETTCTKCGLLIDED